MAFCRTCVNRRATVRMAKDGVAAAVKRALLTENSVHIAAIKTAKEYLADQEATLEQHESECTA